LTTVSSKRSLSLFDAAMISSGAMIGSVIILAGLPLYRLSKKKDASS